MHTLNFPLGNAAVGGVALGELLNFSQPCFLMCKMRTIIIHFMGFERINKERFLPHADNLLKACSILIMQSLLSEVRKSIPRGVITGPRMPRDDRQSAKENAHGLSLRALYPS